MTFGQVTFISSLLCGLLTSGCNERASEQQRYPVRGTVLLNDAPLAEAMVVFHPKIVDDHMPRPVAQTNAAGEFVLTTLTPADGAPAGEYSITVELRAKVQIGEELVREGADLLPRRFRIPQESGLAYTVTEGNNVVPPLKLTDR